MQTTQGLSKTGAGSADIEAGNEADNEADKKTKKKRKYNTSKNNPRRPLTVSSNPTLSPFPNPHIKDFIGEAGSVLFARQL